MNLIIKTFIAALCILAFSERIQAQSIGAKDTIITGAMIYEGDTLEAKVLSGVYIYTTFSRSRSPQWTRLRNAVYVTYPYAKRGSWVFNDVEAHIKGKSDQDEIHKYISSREKELKKEFAQPLMNLSVYQGRILMKLIKRETGDNVYEILKEFKGGFSASFWQTVAFVFGSNLKQPYDAKGDDKELESIVREVERMYGFRG